MEEDEIFRWGVSLIKQKWSQRQPPYELPADSIIADIITNIIKVSQQSILHKIEKETTDILQ